MLKKVFAVVILSFGLLYLGTMACGGGGSDPAPNINSTTGSSTGGNTGSSGSGSSGGSTTGGENSTDRQGNWTLQINGCNGTYIFAQNMTLTYFDTRTNAGGKPADSYKITNTSGYPDNFALVEQGSGNFFVCLSPAGDLIASSCVNACTGVATDTNINAYCQTNGNNFCGPIIYTKD